MPHAAAQEVFGLLHLQPAKHLNMGRCQVDRSVLFTLWRLRPNALAAALFKLFDIADDAPVQFHIAPSQPKAFTSPRSGSQSDQDSGVELGTHRRIEQL